MADKEEKKPKVEKTDKAPKSEKAEKAERAKAAKGAAKAPAGEREPDEGDLVSARGVRIGYLPQDILELPQGSLVESVRSAVGDKARIDAALAAVHEDLDAAMKTALREMIGFICSRSSLSRDQAYQLCSLAVDST